MGRIMDMAGEKYHRRTIDMNIYNVDKERFAVTGRFLDLRCRESRSFTGEIKKAGPLHDLEIHLLVSKAGLVIKDIEVFLNTVPREDCWSVGHVLDGVVGLSVKGGFTREVRNIGGGKTGCTHLVHLLSTMASALVQGFWAIQDDEITGADEKAERARRTAGFIKDSCYTWREEGETFKTLKALGQKG